MNYLKKFGLAFVAAAFLMSVGAAANYAQRGKGQWNVRSGGQRGWTQVNRYGWNRNGNVGRQYRRAYYGQRRTPYVYYTQRRTPYVYYAPVQTRRVYSYYGQNRRYQNRNYNQNRYYNRAGSYGYGRITPREAYRLQRQRNRLYRSANRYYRDGYLTERENRRLARRYNNYRRSVYRDRRDY